VSSSAESPPCLSTAYRFRVEKKPAYVHISGSGTHSAEDLRRFLTDAARAAAASRCDSVLLELNFTGGSLDFGSLYPIIRERAADAKHFKRIAFVDVNPQHRVDRAEFVELAAIQLGVNVQRFQCVADAHEWLQA
jgi:hypothetical protein